MPSDKTTVATKADFVPKAVRKTDRDRSVSSVLAHDERSQQPRPGVQQTQLNVLSYIFPWILSPAVCTRSRDVNLGS